MALTKNQELEAAYKRQLAGSASDTDKANLAYATSKGIWKAPVESGSLQGTNTAERTLPTSQSPITDFKSALKEATRIAYGNKPTSAILEPYKASGMSMTNPSLINYAIQGDVEQRAGRLTDLYNNTMSAIEEQEKTRQQASKYGQDILANMMQTSFAKSITGADYESIMKGEMPTELITKWGEYLQTAEAQEDIKKPSISDQLAAKAAGYDIDEQNKLVPMVDFELPKVGDIGGQCGSYLFGIMGDVARFGDSLEEKMTKVNKQKQDVITNPQVGDILVFKTRLPHGHVAAITNIDGNMVTVTESNWVKNEKGEGLVGTRTFDITKIPNLEGAVTGGTFKSSTNSKISPNISQVTKKPLTETERLSRTYANRLTEASTTIDDLEADFTGFWENVKTWATPEGWKSEDKKLLEQAQRNFINAQLRRESGAAIADSEFDNARKQYFPQPGDTDKVLEKKRENRRTVIDGMLLSGGIISSPTQESSVINDDDAYLEYQRITNKK